MSDQRTLRIARAKRKQSAFRQRRALLHKYNTIPSFYSNINRRQQQQRGVRHNDNIARGIRAHFAWQAVRQQMQNDINHQQFIRAQRIKRRNHQMEWHHRQQRERIGPYAHPWRHPEEIRIDKWNARFASKDPKDQLWIRAQKQKANRRNRLLGLGKHFLDAPN